MEVNNEINPAEREKILLFAKDQYLREGFYKTSMDTIAAELRMSKKTIYKYFPSKEVLVGAVVESLMVNISSRINETIESQDDAVTKLRIIHEVLSKTLMRFSDKWLNDMRLHTPELWEKIDDFRTKKMFNMLSRIYEQGKQEGLFLDKPNEILVTLFIASLRAIVNPDFLYFNKFSYDEAVRITFDILFTGILTKEGKNKYKRNIKREEK